jgi:hypothetical protein
MHDIACQLTTKEIRGIKQAKNYEAITKTKNFKVLQLGKHKYIHTSLKIVNAD